MIILLPSFEDMIRMNKNFKITYLVWWPLFPSYEGHIVCLCGWWDTNFLDAEPRNELFIYPPNSFSVLDLSMHAHTFFKCIVLAVMNGWFLFLEQFSSFSTTRQHLSEECSLFEETRHALAKLWLVLIIVKNPNHGLSIYAHSRETMVYRGLFACLSVALPATTSLPASEEHQFTPWCLCLPSQSHLSLVCEFRYNPKHQGQVYLTNSFWTIVPNPGLSSKEDTVSRRFRFMHNVNINHVLLHKPWFRVILEPSQCVLTLRAQFSWS